MIHWVKRTASRDSDRYSDTNIHCGVIHNSQMIITTQVPTDR